MRGVPPLLPHPSEPLRAEAAAPAGGRSRRRVAWLLALAVTVLSGRAAAQDNYEIQVYGAELVPVGRTMVELHSNFTFSGTRAEAGGLQPTYHALHETLEVTHGFTSWLEVGFYAFTSARDGDGLQWVGSHVRPRVAIPASWEWPVGLSLSQEIGYQRRAFSEDTWSWEIRPIIDRQLGSLYASFNPTVEVALKGENAGQGVEFAPNALVSLDVAPRVNFALEYYGGFGDIGDFVPLAESQQMIIPAINLDLGPTWEFNVGVGIGLTDATDKSLVKVILGRRVG